MYVELVAGSCEHVNEPSGFIKVRDWLSEYYLLKKGSAPGSLLVT
jgi:hypothetical protein